MLKRLIWAAVGGWALSASAVFADVAVLIGNTTYDGLPDVQDAQFALSVEDPLKEGIRPVCLL